MLKNKTNIKNEYHFTEALFVIVHGFHGELRRSLDVDAISLSDRHCRTSQAPPITQVLSQVMDETTAIQGSAITPLRLRHNPTTLLQWPPLPSLQSFLLSPPSSFTSPLSPPTPHLLPPLLLHHSHSSLTRSPAPCALYHHRNRRKSVPHLQADVLLLLSRPPS